MATATEKVAKLIDAVVPAKAGSPPPDVMKRVARAAKGLGGVSARRQEAQEFARNKHFVNIDKTGLRIEAKSVTPISQGGEKLNHRVRISHDVLAPILHSKVSAATQRIPGYEVIEASSDPEDYSAARLAKNIAVAGYDKWKVREAFRRAVWLALVTEEAFIMPYWDSSIGPFAEIPPYSEGNPGSEPDYFGMGDIRLAVYGGLEVSWEPGIQFEEARWYVITHARAIEDLEAEEGYIGGKLTADADRDNVIGRPKMQDGGNLAMVTEYFERPCRSFPDGRRIVTAQKRLLFAEEDYPLRDENDEVVDAPCLHRLYYAVDGGSERARGLVQSLIETIRRYDFSANKAAEYLQLVLVPQMIAPEGAVVSEITDAPGDLIEIDPSELAGGEVKWRELPSMPREFSDEQNAALSQLSYISNESLTTSGGTSGKEVEAQAQKAMLAWQDFIEQEADVHAAVMRDALVLAQLFYTEDRMMKFRGRTGWESIPDFRGADIRGQTDVRVQPGSLEPLTRPAIEQRIINLVHIVPPGFFAPDEIIAALSEGNVDRLNQRFEEAEENANFIIGQIRAGTFRDLPKRPAMQGEEVPRLSVETGQPEWQVPPQFGPEGLTPGTGIPIMETEVSGWMPRPFDNLPVIRRRFETFMSSDEWRRLDPEALRATDLYYNAVLELEAAQEAKSAVQQNQTAEELGAQNAAKPQQAKPLPSLPAPSGSEEEQPSAQQ